MDKLERALDDLRRKWVPDRRLGVFEVELVGEGEARQPTGATTSSEALDAVRLLAVGAGVAAAVTLLPDTSVGTDEAAVVVAPVAPLLGLPNISGERVNECLHGEVLRLLERRDPWLRVRGWDGYHGWMHEGYVATGPTDWAEDWTARATARSLGVELLAEGQRLRLPIGARLAPRRDGTVETADGRIASLVTGAVRAEGEIRTEARMIAAPELGLRWFSGAPYQWGGRTEWGIDCSGFAQAVYAARGVPLPRDSDLQMGAGREIPLTADGGGWEAGDLLYFVEHNRVSHVALWAGAGRIVHSALARGGVAGDHLFGDAPRLRRLRERLVGVRRVESRGAGEGGGR